LTSALRNLSILALSRSGGLWSRDIASDEIAWTDHLAAVFPDIPAKSLRRQRIREIDRNAALDPDGCAEKSAGAGRGDGVPYRI